MTLMRLATRLLVAVFAVAAALVAGNAMRDARSGAATESPPPMGNGLAAVTASPRVDTCDALARVKPSIPPPLEVVDLGNGTTRVTSSEAGYSITVPSSWTVKPGLWEQPLFGQSRITSYDPASAPTPDPERWMMPPEVGIVLDLQVWSNADGAALDEYAKRVSIGPDHLRVVPGTSATVGGQPAYRFTILEEHRFQPQDRPLVVTRQTRVVWLVQSPRRDRIIVANAAPAESPLLAAVERAISGLTITAPMAARYAVTRSREDVLRQWLYDKDGRGIPGRRAEAKLMTYAESSAALHPGGGLLRLDHDPDDLYWVVAVSGPDLPLGRRGPLLRSPATSTPTPTAWMLFTTSATGDNIAGTGARYSTQGTWPSDFDALPDRCR
ncbi:MAG TPA: hypothetical protein VFM06_00765 [Candidatus Limnocylindria bacterium]|nr:hypothetical protein [Candidatus Limnocylindria bacterium]